jgi:hypothetical protein
VEKKNGQEKLRFIFEGIKLINIYIKAGTIKGNSVISLILKSQKYKWTKTFRIEENLPKNSFTKSITLDALCMLYALRHVKDRYRKKKVLVYSDSSHLIGALKKKNGEYTNKTKIGMIDNLRNYIGTFSNLHIKNFTKECEYKEELEHIFVECALDQIEIDEKD